MESIRGERVHVRAGARVCIDVLMQKRAAITYSSACKVSRESRSVVCASGKLLLTLADPGLYFSLWQESFASTTVLMIIKV